MKQSVAVRILLNGVAVPAFSSVRIRKSRTISASECHLLVDDWRSENSAKFKLNDRLEVYLGLGIYALYPAFIGYITARKSVISQTERGLEVTALDYLGKLQTQYAELTDESNYDGWEIASVIKALVDGLDGTPAEFVGETTSPAKAVPMAYRVSRKTRLALIKDMLATYAYDDPPEDGAIPTEYLLRAQGVGAAKPAIRFQREPTAIAANVARTFAYGTDIHAVGIEYRPHEDALTVKGKDAQFTYADAQLAAGIGYLEGGLVSDGTLLNVDECQTVARRLVQASRLPGVSLDLTTTGAFDIEPGDVVLVQNAPRNLGAETYNRVHEVDLQIGATEAKTRITLVRARPFLLAGVS